jgi:acyl-CoA synthetase (AMP-forming)/AMP-acid ligase II
VPGRVPRSVGGVPRLAEDWNFADVWETISDTIPDDVAQVHGRRRFSWSEFGRRADGIAAALLAAGLGHQDTVAIDLYNGPEYLQAVFGALKAGLVPVNTNYRYVGAELRYLWDDADAAAVVFHGSLTETVASVRAELPRVRIWLHVDDGTQPCPPWAAPFDAAADAATGRITPPRPRSGDDLILIYTGGTTGRPKGVVWRQHDLYRASDVARDPPAADLSHVRSRVLRPGRRPVGLPAAPLMHGTGLVFAATVLSRGGTVVTSASRRLDPVELLDLIDSWQVSALCIVGDAFCRPLVDALTMHPDRWDLSQLSAVSSSGMAWSAELKSKLLTFAPGAVLVDMLNSSEASGMGRSIVSARRRDSGGRFRLGDNAFVIDEHGKPVRPGSGQVGLVAVRGHLPLRYHKDPVKTAATFPVIDGIRCSVPGDHAVVEADGSITLLGRGSTSINTGGEKVFPEEVEEALKTHRDVLDAVVVGIPDRRFGQAVAAVVAVGPGTRIDADALAAHVRDRLAAYKAPRHVLVTDSVGRGPNGKADYVATRQRIEEWLATDDQVTR